MERAYRISLLYVLGIAIIILIILIIPRMYPPDKAGSLPEEPLVVEEESAIPITNQEIIITKDTKIIYIDTYLDCSITNDATVIPSQYVGKTQEEFVSALEAELQSPDELNTAKGWYDYHIVEYTSSQIILEKIYHSEKKDYFYLGLVNDYVVVFCEDKQTIYLNTGILSQELPNDISKEIMNYKMICTSDELFDFLEAYTS